jgi:molybdenum cofactor cytidylyltransferase
MRAMKAWAIRSLPAVAAALAGASVVLPSHLGMQGHPVGFAADCRDALLLLRGPQGAALVARARKMAGSAVDLALGDVGIVTDIDTIADLARAQKMLAAPPFHAR